LRDQSEDSCSLQVDTYLDPAPNCVKACGPIVGTSNFAIYIDCWIGTIEMELVFLVSNCSESRRLSSQVSKPELSSVQFLGIIGQNYSVSKSNQLHAVNFRFFFIDLRYVPQIPLK
jgi:hypothetical protein